ncbi:hypothetical protein BKP45_05000 [Anaerobacillus alkalidiazotrophicus]|uniref:Uncharacterized protein n=2 Tax=Anaerobacillus alkalidiazotrophicus TaxID=472963 RepID=A0A1S2MCW0_9BACI|nr:hypothetical protein BKP45_05000 [Anaerobacillus alkalidiazotrophicus]
MRAVQQAFEHRHKLRGDQSMSDQKYAATYQFGKTKVHIVAPEPVSKEEHEQRVREFHLAGWAIWNSLPVEKRLSINEAAAGEE